MKENIYGIDSKKENIYGIDSKSWRKFSADAKKLFNILMKKYNVNELYDFSEIKKLIEICFELTEIQESDWV
jgi:hypothetical protein